MKKIFCFLLATYTPVGMADLFYPYNMPWNWFDDGGQHGISHDYLSPMIYDYPLAQGNYENYYPYAPSQKGYNPPQFRQPPAPWHNQPPQQPRSLQR